MPADSASNSFVYRAPRWLLWSVVAALALFLALALYAVTHDGVSRLALWVGIVGVLLGVLGVFEMLLGRIILERDQIVIHQWYRTERLELEDVASVSLEGGLVSLRLKTGSWKRLPEWIGANRSLGQRLRDRLKRSPPG